MCCCYAVSVQQVIHYCTSALPDPGHVGSLLEFHSEAQIQHSQGASLRIDGFSMLLRLQPTWLFADAQQDAAEYSPTYVDLCQADLGALQPVSWLETRADAIIAQGLSRSAPFFFPCPLGFIQTADRREEASVNTAAQLGRPGHVSSPPTSISLADLLSAWHRTEDTVSFLQYYPPVLAVSLPRFLRAVKLAWKLDSLDGDYLLPSGRPGYPIVTSPILHTGRSLSPGSHTTCWPL